MADSKARTGRAAVLHRQAAAVVDAAASALGGLTSTHLDPEEQYRLAERLRTAGLALTPGWLGATLDDPGGTLPQVPIGAPMDIQSPSTGAEFPPRFVRLGTARPLDDATFPAIVPLLGTGHLTVDVDARDQRVSGLLRSVLLRLLATAPAGSLLVRGVDGVGGGAVFSPFETLADAGLMSPPALDRVGLRAVLAEGEQWLRPQRAGTPRRGRRDRVLLLVIASLPELTDSGDLSRIVALAEQGPESGLHLIVAGWPPSPAQEGHQTVLPRSTAVSLRQPYAVIGDPPGATYAAPAEPGTAPSTWLNAPIQLDAAPPAHLLVAMCEQLVAQSVAASRLTLADVLPEPEEQWWTGDAADGLGTTVGHDGDTPLPLRFNDMTPHWMIGGRSGAGKTAFLINVLYGLGSRYAPAELSLYLLDFKEGVSFTEFVPTPRDHTWLPHARAVGVESDREYGLAVLRELDAEMTRRSVAYKRAGVSRFAELRTVAAEEGRLALPRILCVIDEYQVLLAGADAMATEAVALLESLARKGRSYGIHLVLASQTVSGVEALYAKRDSIFGQFPVRIALPGGGDVLEPANDSAAGLPLGTAVINTAGGLGGPRGATRGHERVIRFPDPHADPAALGRLRHRLWQAREPDAAPPRVFAGYAHQQLADDPTYRAVLAGRGGRPAALVGRVIDVGLSTATFPLDGSPGRHLAVFGSQSAGADVLDAAARSIAAYHAPGTSRFVICSLVAEGDETAKALAAEIGQRHEAALVDAAGLAAEWDLSRPGYRVVFGMDAAAAGTVPTDRLRRLLREGPGHGSHLLAWWRGLRRFSDEVGGSSGREDVAGMIFLNVTGPDVSLLLGRPTSWHPRENRALLYDRHADRAVVMVPFARPEGTE